MRFGELVERTFIRLPHRRTFLIRYSFATLLVIGVTWLRLPLGGWLGNSVPFLLYFPALVCAGWFGGLGPGLWATVVSGYFAKTWFFEPVGTFSIDNWPSAFRLLLFLLSGGLISYLCGRLHRHAAQLAAEKDALEEKVRQRTAHLERALQDLETFSLSVSHDLRSPLRTICGYTEALMEDHGRTLESGAAEYLARINKAAMRLDRLIDDLLSFAKVTGAGVELLPINVREHFAAVVEASAQLNVKEVDLACDGCDQDVLAHPALLHQAFKNLLENAVKFVAPGTKPVVRVWTESRGEWTRIWIADNGIGIPEDARAKIFGMFERAGGSSYPGTGLGLAIVQRAVVRMNGRIGVESTVGRGVGSSRVDLQACKLEYSIVSPK